MNGKTVWLPREDPRYSTLLEAPSVETLEALLDPDWDPATDYVAGSLRLGTLTGIWGPILRTLRDRYLPFQPFMKALARYGVDNVPLDAAVMPDGTMLDAEDLLPRRQKEAALASAA